MSWEIARQKNYNALKRFIIRREWACTAFSARLRSLKLNRLTPGADCMVMIHHNHSVDAIEDAVMLTRHGLVFPVFSERFYPDTDLDLTPIRQPLHQYVPKLHSVIGLASDVEKIAQVLPCKPFEQIDYYLMTLTSGQLTRHQSAQGNVLTQDHPDSGAYEIREADVQDAEKLYTLQKNYEIEEVFLNPARFDSRVCFLNLKKTLKKELVFYIEKEGVALAKAGTNARGFFTDQIGGVYTMKEARRNGIAYRLLFALLEKLLIKKQTVSLFVRKTNTPAISLYLKLGFRIRDNFNISYY